MSGKDRRLSELVFIVRILIPLTKSAIGAMAVYTFINAYNMYMWPLLVTGTEEMRTVQIGISMLNSVDSQSITMVIAGSCDGDSAVAVCVYLRTKAADPRYVFRCRQGLT